MSERPKHWIKLWVSWLTTPAHLELSGGALGLGPLLLLLATWDGEYGSGGWLLGEDGRPYSRKALARATHRDGKELDAELAELVRCGTLTVREDGALGFAKFGRWQETRNAKYNRVARKSAHDGAHSVHDSGQQREQQTVDGRRQTTELAAQARTPNPLPAPVGSESPAEHVAVVATASKPTATPKPRKPRAAFPDGLDLHLLAELRAACKRLGRHGPRVETPTPGMRDSLAKLYAAEAPTAEALTHVVHVREELDQAGDQFGSLDWEHLCRPANFRRYRDRATAVPSSRKAWTPSDFGNEP